MSYTPIPLAGIAGMVALLITKEILPQRPQIAIIIGFAVAISVFLPAARGYKFRGGL